MDCYIQGQGLISQRRGSNSYFYHYDGLGSTKALTDANQNVQASYKYDAWGNILQTSGTITNPYLYVGELGYYGDGDAGMYLLTQRWYNPVVGRFVVRDPIWAQAMHFTYCQSNPQRFTDPTGLMWDAEYCVESFKRCLDTAGLKEGCHLVGHAGFAEWVRVGGCAIGCGIIGYFSRSVYVGVGCFMICYGGSYLIEQRQISLSRTKEYIIERQSCEDAFRFCCYMVNKYRWSDPLLNCAFAEQTLRDIENKFSY